MRLTLIVWLSAILCITLNAQELKLPSLSPGAMISQDFSTTKIEITYNRPSMRGRAIFGDLVPYDQLWRTGANASTKITFGEELEIGGVSVPAGTYSFYTRPGRTEWEVILNKNLGAWGTSGYSESDDVARFKVKPQTLVDPVETFTLSVSALTFSTCQIEIVWERTRLVVPVKSNNNSRLVAAIDKAINNPARPYQAAAGYFLETGQHLDKALDYIDKAIELNSKAYWLPQMKARIAARLGNKALAVSALELSNQIATGLPNADDVRRTNQKILDSIK